jgi:sulfur carrier protein ThiS
VIPAYGKDRTFPIPFLYFQEHDPMSRILLINNDGGGFADYIDIAEGTTVAALFAERVPHGRPQDYLIRVNRQPVPADQVLQEGDRVSLTPTKIEGGRPNPAR